MSEWNAMTYEGKETILRVVRHEAERFFALADNAEAWERQTACDNWTTRDAVAHIVDTTEGYFRAFDAARSGGEAPAPFGLPVMHEKADEFATAFRGVPREELMQRLRDDFHKMQEILDALGPDDWTGLMITHPYMGPVPAFFYAAGQLMDYGVHSWDIRQGSGKEHGLSGDAADLLVPFMFEIWRGTVQHRRGDRAVHHRHPGQRAQRRRLPGLGEQRGPGLRAGRHREPAGLHRVRRRQHGAVRVRPVQLRHGARRHGPGRALPQSFFRI